MARERKPFRLGLDPAIYNPTGLQAYVEDKGINALKSEYSRLRREAKQRLDRLGRSEFSWTRAYQDNVNRFKRLDQIKDPRELMRLTQEAARFVTARGSSASGQRGIRRDALDSLHAHGYDFVNTRNFRDFTNFMEDLRASGLDRLFYKSTADREETADPDMLRDMFETYQETGELEWMGE